MTFAVWFALANSAGMIVAAVSVIFFHDRKYGDIEQLIDYSFSANVLKRVLLYYRGFGVLMLFFFLVFSISVYMLQAVDGRVLFAEGRASLFGIMLFAFDLVARGAFFDWMEHFEFSLSPLSMNRSSTWFVLYAFVFRMFYALTLLRILISFAWIWRKIAVAKREHETGLLRIAAREADEREG
ncbi:MAG: hypothetical protein GC150_10850 [Rhizobiales bacterium]|nr:hypothetical protein [Hyphomicrobiales bacterium]